MLKRSLLHYTQTVAESLATVVLLDNASIPDTLESILGARARTLAALLAEGAEAGNITCSRRPNGAPSALASSSSLPASGNDIEDVVRKATEALGLILRTHQHVETVFVRQSHKASEEPLLLQLLGHLQQQPSAAPTGDLQPSAISAAEDIGLVPILNTLPNVHLLLRYLPSQIVAFTPFVDTTSARNVLTAESAHNMLATWFSDALSTLEIGLTRLLAMIPSAKQLASARSALHSFLTTAKAGQGAFWHAQIASLAQTVDCVLRKRFGEIYNMRLLSFLRSVPETLQATSRALSGSAEDLEPSLFLFSNSIPFPSSSLFSSSSAPSGATKSPTGFTLQRNVREAGDPFVMFQKAIGKRVAGRSPMLDTCLGELEAAATSIRIDVTAWLDGESGEDERVASEYQSAVMSTLQELGDLLRASLEGAADIAQQLFVGSVALHIALESSLVPDLRLSNADVPRDVIQKLLDIERSSLQRWHGVTVSEVTGALRQRFAESLELPPAANRKRYPYALDEASIRLTRADICSYAVHSLQAFRLSPPVPCGARACHWHTGSASRSGGPRCGPRAARQPGRAASLHSVRRRTETSCRPRLPSANPCCSAGPAGSRLHAGSAAKGTRAEARDWVDRLGSAGKGAGGGRLEQIALLHSPLRTYPLLHPHSLAPCLLKRMSGACRLYSARRASYRLSSLPAVTPHRPPFYRSVRHRCRQPSTSSLRSRSLVRDLPSYR